MVSIIAASLLDTLRALPCAPRALARLAARFGTPFRDDMTGAVPDAASHACWHVALFH